MLMKYVVRDLACGMIVDVQIIMFVIFVGAIRECLIEVTIQFSGLELVLVALWGKL